MDLQYIPQITIYADESLTGGYSSAKIYEDEAIYITSGVSHGTVDNGFKHGRMGAISLKKGGIYLVIGEEDIDLINKAANKASAALAVASRVISAEKWIKAVKNAWLTGVKDGRAEKLAEIKSVLSIN